LVKTHLNMVIQRAYITFKYCFIASYNWIRVGIRFEASYVALKVQRFLDFAVKNSMYYHEPVSVDGQYVSTEWLFFKTTAA